MRQVSVSAFWRSSLLSSVAAVLAASAPAVAADQPSGRSYVLVSPGDTNGVDVQSPVKVSADGNAVGWVSLGAYADTQGANGELPYVARRAGDGSWSTRSFFPRLTDYFRTGFFSFFGGYSFSDDLSTLSVLTSAAVTADDRDLGYYDVFRLTEDGRGTMTSTAVDVPLPNEAINVDMAGASRDGGAVFFETTEALSSEVSAGGSAQHLYRWNDGQVELVGRDQTGALLTGGSQLGSGGTSVVPSAGNAGDLADSNAVSRDGSAFVYSGYPSSNPSVQQVYLHRSDGSVKLISASQRSGDVGTPSATNARFVSAVGDLSIIYFSSAEQLTDDAPAGGGDYRYDVATGRLSFSNVDDAVTTGFGGGFIRASEDGRYVYFASTRDLADGATDGALNLYVQTPDELRYISPVSDQDLKLTVGRSGSRASTYTNTWVGGEGKTFLYETRASATERDTRGRTQVYRYDLGSDSVVCISCNPRSETTTGDAGLATPDNDGFYNIPAPRALSADGSRVIFGSDEGLVAEDTNEVRDIYEWVNGQIFLVSTGASGTPSRIVGMSEDGHDVFFSTRSALVPEDRDSGLVDIYNATLGPVPSRAPQPEPCAGDDCQGPIPGPFAPESPGSTTTNGPGNVTPKADTATYSVGRVSSAAVKRLARTGRLTVKVKVGQAGRVNAIAFARVKGVSARVASGRKAAKKASTVRMTLKLSKAARKQLRVDRRLKVRLSVTFSAAPGSVSTSFTLRAPKTRKGR